MKSYARSVRALAQAGLIAAMYTALTVVTAPLSFGAIQCRPAEALTVLAVFTPTAIPGLTVGCVLANLIGIGMGANVAGALDLICGTLATGVAAWLGYAARNRRVRGLPLLAVAVPVVFNAAVVGTELTLLSPTPTIGVWCWQAALVAAGELVACVGGGLALFRVLTATGWDRRLFKI